MQMAQGDAGFLKGSTRSGGAAPHPNTGDLETSALFPEFTTGEGRQSAQVLGSPEQGFRAPERVTRSLWDPSPRRARFRAPASTAPGQPETCPRPGRAARPSRHPTPESDEGGSEKHCGHKACLLRYADPRDESISAENRGRLLLGLRHHQSTQPRATTQRFSVIVGKEKEHSYLFILFLIKGANCRGKRPGKTFLITQAVHTPAGCSLPLPA